LTIRTPTTEIHSSKPQLPKTAARKKTKLEKKEKITLKKVTSTKKIVIKAG
jgi:hypothetical protein